MSPQEKCAEFNAKVKPGFTKLMFQASASAKPQLVQTKTEAWVKGSDVVVMIEGMNGHWNIDLIEWNDDAFVVKPFVRFVTADSGFTVDLTAIVASKVDPVASAWFGSLPGTSVSVCVKADLGTCRHIHESWIRVRQEAIYAPSATGAYSLNGGFDIPGHHPSQDDMKKALEAVRQVIEGER